MKRVRTAEWARQHLTKLGCAPAQIDRHVAAMTKVPADDGPAPVRRERRDHGDAIDSYAARGILNVTKLEFTRLTESPAFPSPIAQTRFEVRWSRKEIDAFKVKVEQVRAQGWKIDALYRWEFDRPMSWADRRARYANKRER